MIEFGRRHGYGAHDYYDAMTTSDEPWKWASAGTGIGGMIIGVALAFLVNPIAGALVMGIGMISSVICAIVAHVKHNSELHHYIMEDRKRMADHMIVQERSMGIGDNRNIAETEKIQEETKRIRNTNADISKETVNRTQRKDMNR